MFTSQDMILAGVPIDAIKRLREIARARLEEAKRQAESIRNRTTYSFEEIDEAEAGIGVWWKVQNNLSID
jgi:ribosomal protein L7/L12